MMFTRFTGVSLARDFVPRYPFQLLLVAVGYFLAGRLGLAAPFVNSNVSPVWPAAGIGLTAVLLFGYRIWPGITVAAFLVNYFTDIPHAAAAGISIGNTVALLLCAALLKRVLNFENKFQRTTDVFGFILLVALSMTVSALIGVANLYMFDLQPWAGLNAAWLVWWLGDVLGVMTVCPLLLALLNRKETDARSTELALILGVVAFESLLIFDNRVMLEATEELYGFLLLPLVIWAAIRHGMVGASATTAVISFIAVFETSRNSGSFVKSTPFENVLLLQLFISIVTITGMALAAVIAERQTVKQALQREEALRKSQEALQTAERAALLAFQEAAKWEQILQQAAFGLAIMEPYDSKLKAVNPSFAEMHGYAPEELIGRSLYSTLAAPEAGRPPATQLRGPSDNGHQVYESIHVRKNGTRFPVLTDLTTFRDTNGKVMFRAAYFQDISERKKSEEILRQSEKMAAAGRVAATISHEINNPLAAITNLIYLAKSESSAEQIREYLEMADRELKHVTNLSKTALGFYRTSNKIQVVDMGVVVESVTSIYRRAMDKKNLRLVLQLRPEIQVMGLEAELKQVVSNLVSNAMDACPQRGSLCIRVRCVAGQVQLSIADTGSGIPAADTHRIFEPFFTANKANGTGLGLWISQQIIERHKGRIRVYSSTREGKSFSVFSVLLPAVAGQSVAVA